MLNNPKARKAVKGFIDPPAKGLLKLGVTPDAVTYAGTIGAAAAALWFFPRGQFVWGVIIIVLFIFSDLLDGTMARLSGHAGPWGNLLDSTLDRVADGAIFGSILIYFASRGEAFGTAAAWVCLVGAFTISYSKARAESVGAKANVGIAERAERLIVILVAAFLQGLGVPWILTIATGILAVLVVITVGQRFAFVKAQLFIPPSKRPEEEPAAQSADTTTEAPETETQSEEPDTNGSDKSETDESNKKGEDDHDA